MECDSCGGSGTHEYRVATDVDSSDGVIGTLVSGLTRVLSVFHIETPCGACGGTGEREETRELFLDELSTLQSSFLYQAELERAKARNGGETDDNTANHSSPNIPSNPKQAAQSVSNPSATGPPVRGNTHNF